MRNYEIIFIVRPDATEEDVEKLISQMEGVVTGTGGSSKKWRRWAAARLAYRVAKQRRGIYVLFRLQVPGDTVKEFERRLKVIDTVIKYMTVRIDEDLERAVEGAALKTGVEEAAFQAGCGSGATAGCRSTPSLMNLFAWRRASGARRGAAVLAPRTAAKAGIPHTY